MSVNTTTTILAGSGLSTAYALNVEKFKLRMWGGSPLFGRLTIKARGAMPLASLCAGAPHRRRKSCLVPLGASKPRAMQQMVAALIGLNCARCAPPCSTIYRVL